jgi:hypothetical protein
VSQQRARGAIFDDLSTLHRERRARFGMNAAVVAFVIGGMVAAMLRSDLLTQPVPALVAQISLWGLGIFVLPAIGVGLWFPRRGSSVALVIATIALASMATLWPTHGPVEPAGLEPRCLVAVGMVGAVALAATVLTGAFLQCQRTSTKRWLAGGIGILSLVATVWMCSEPGVVHMLTSHIGAALVVGLVAGWLGARARRSRDRLEAGRRETQSDRKTP